MIMQNNNFDTLRKSPKNFGQVRVHDLFLLIILPGLKGNCCTFLLSDIFLIFSVRLYLSFLFKGGGVP